MYNPYDFNFSTRDWCVSDIVKRLPTLSLTYTPRCSWDLTTSSRFIESLLIRIPLDKVWIEAVGNDKYELIDGHWRVAVLQNYLSDVFQLEGLEYLVEPEGLSFNQLPRHLQRRLEETSIGVVVIESGTPKTIRDSLIARVLTRPGTS
ncbi:hypothetical protein [Microcoleus phage My-WqHQDG]|nr:hypothetical protein [Microcoleus phage My-WqHQDG]